VQVVRSYCTNVRHVFRYANGEINVHYYNIYIYKPSTRIAKPSVIISCLLNCREFNEIKVFRVCAVLYIRRDDIRRQRCVFCTVVRFYNRFNIYTLRIKGLSKIYANQTQPVHNPISGYLCQHILLYLLDETYTIYIL